MTESAQRQAWRRYDGAASLMVGVEFAGARFKVAEPTVDAWKALETVLEAHGYDVRPENTFGYGPRNVKNTQTRSLHSFGIAIDVNSTTNPDKPTPTRRKVKFSTRPTQAERGAETGRGEKDPDTDMTPGMIEDVKAIRTKGGKQLFGWGGDWSSKKDAMHFHIDVSPAEMSSGVDWGTVKRAGASYDDRRDDDVLDDVIDYFREYFDETGSDTAMGSSDRIERFRPMLDFIALHEGTTAPRGSEYNTSLEYGRFTGGEKNLTSMTLAQIEALQGQMLDHPANHYNSSALGRYQIVRRTLRDLKRQLGLSSSLLYSAGLQDRLAVALIQRRGRSVSGLREEWASLKKVDAAKILAAYDKEGSGGGVIVPPDVPLPPMVDIEEWLRRYFTNGGIGGGFRLPNPRIMLKRGDRGPQVSALQTALAQRNYKLGKIDGIYGSMTVGAVSSFQHDHNVPTDAIGSVDAVTWEMLNSGLSRPLEPARAQATADDLRKEGSVIVANADRTRLLGLIASLFGITGVGHSAYDNLILPRTTPPTGSTAKAIDAAKENLAQVMLNIDVAQAKALAPLFTTNATSLKTLTDAQTAIEKAQATLRALNYKISAAPAAVTETATNLADPLANILSLVANSVLPGFGGSLLALALGVGTHVFGGKIIDQRVRRRRDSSDMGDPSL